LTIPQLLTESKTIAVVGLSSNLLRPSHSVAEYMQRQGYRIIPVNPSETEVLGERAYPSLDDVPGPVDIVNIFRRPNQVGAVVEQALRKPGVKAIWMQLGIENPEAAAAAEAGGLFVVMDRCILIEHRQLRGSDTLNK
jgi:predicted CoA-binding protein